jgi:hypothetical protein
VFPRQFQNADKKKFQNANAAAGKDDGDGRRWPHASN